MDDYSDAQPQGEVSAEDGKRRTWPAGIPPMRLNRSVGSYRAGKQPATPTYDAAPPNYLRPLRAAIGIVLLSFAWIALLAVVIFGQMVWRRLTSARPLSFHLSLYVLSLAGTCWVAVVAIACIVAGAFSLALAITRRGW